MKDINIPGRGRINLNLLDDYQFPQNHTVLEDFGPKFSKFHRVSKRLKVVYNIYIYIDTQWSRIYQLVY